MRQVASAPDETAVRLFADVLCARGIDTDVKNRDGLWSVWVLDEEQVESARALFAAFEANPAAPEFAAARGSVERMEAAKAAEGRRSRHQIIDVRRRFRAPSSPARVTFALVMASVAVTALVRFGRQPHLENWLFIGRAEEVALQKPLFYVFHGELWRLVTPIFLHLSFLHILFNMWWLVDLGSLIERRIGSLRFSSLVLTTAILSNVCQYLWTGSPYFGGMSGVIYALFGYVWIRGRLDPTIGFFVPPSATVILLVWLAIGFTGQIGQVANIAHLSDLVAGSVLGGAAGLIRRR